MAIEVTVQFAHRDRSVPAAATIKSWVRSALRGLRRHAEVTVRIVGENEGAELNERWRKRPGPTNVLSFPSGDPVPAPQLLGDIVICAPVVQREAREQHKNLPAHWAHLIVHGILHLLGYEHDHRRDAQTMEAIEIRILKRLGYANPYC